MFNLEKVEAAEKLTEAYGQFRWHLDSLIRLVELFSGRDRYSRSDTMEDFCHSCGATGGILRQSMRELARYESQTLSDHGTYSLDL